MMKYIDKIFTVLTLVGVMCSAPAMAALSNGCEKEDNDAISSVLALCSTHVYNVIPANQDVHNLSSTSERQIMDDVIALKTTIITQQMKQQYDYLNSTIRRLKTQLQKAVLTTSLEAAGASSGDSGSSYRSSDRNISLAGAQNCNNQNTTLDVFTCLRNNYNLIYNMSNGGRNPSSELRQQLATDCEIASNNGESDIKIQTECTEAKQIRNATVFGKCMNALNSRIRSVTEKIQQQNSQANMFLNLLGNR